MTPRYIKFSERKNIMPDPTTQKVILKLSQSHVMALVDILCEHASREGHTEVFINCSTNPPTETTIGELLRLFAANNFDEVEIEQVTDATKARAET